MNRPPAGHRTRVPSRVRATTPRNLIGSCSPTVAGAESWPSNRSIISNRLPGRGQRSPCRCISTSLSRAEPSLSGSVRGPKTWVPNCCSTAPTTRMSRSTSSRIRMAIRSASSSHDVVAGSADLIGEVHEVLGDDVPGTGGLEVTRLARAVFSRAANEDGAQTEFRGGFEITVVGGDQGDLRGFEPEDVGGVQIRGGIGFVGTGHLGPEDGVPGQPRTFGDVESQTHIRVRQWGDDESILQPSQSGDRIRPRIEPVPGEIDLI